MDYQANPSEDPNDNTLFSYLKPYKIMTIRNSYRQPSYLDYNFDVKIIKYDLSLPKSTTNQAVFDVIDDYFNNYIERFDSEFFISNLQGKIDEELSKASGLEIDFTTQLVMHETMFDHMIQEVRGNELIIVKLAFPFDPIYDDATGDLIQSSSFDDTINFLPTIDTPDFAGTGMDLHCNVDMGAETDLGDGNVVNSSGTIATVTQTSHGYYTGAVITITGALETGYNGSFDITVLTVNTYTYDMGVTPSASPATHTQGVPITASMSPGNESNRAIGFPIWLGDGTEDDDGDRKVGYYFIRNDYVQDIEIHLFFSDVFAANPTGTVDYGTGIVPTLLALTGTVPKDDTFTDSGYGYVDLKYPGLNSPQGENIPVTENTIPRLRQVKFIS